MKAVFVRVIEFCEQKSFHPRDIIPSFELLTVAEMVKDVCSVKYVDNEILNESAVVLGEKLLADRADVYVFHYRPIATKAIIRIIQALKHTCPRAQFIAFSPGFEQQAHKFLIESGANFVVLGEVEVTLSELIRNMANGRSTKVKGVGYLNEGNYITSARREFVDPDKLPMMAHSLVDPTQYRVVSKIIRPKRSIRWGFILSSRGCPYSCIFCSPSIRNSLGKKYRFQSPKRTVDEMQYLIQQHQVNAISFEDDLFTLDRDRVIQICKEIIKRKLDISWTVATRFDCLDLSMLRLMKKAGCTGMSLGVESGSKRILKLVNKGETLADIKAGILLMHRVGIAPTINLIVGHPTETLTDLYATMRLVKRLKPVFIHLHFLTPYPGTKIYSMFKDKAEGFRALSHWGIHGFNVTAVSDNVLKSMIRKMYFSYYCNLNYLLVYIKYRFAYWVHDPVFEINFLAKTVVYLCLRSSNEIKG